MTYEMAKAQLFGPLVSDMKAILLRISVKERENTFTKMVPNMKDNFQLIRNMVKEYLNSIISKTSDFNHTMKESLKTIRWMGEVITSMRMEITMMVSLKMD